MPDMGKCMTMWYNGNQIELMLLNQLWLLKSVTVIDYLTE